MKIRVAWLFPLLFCLTLVAAAEARDPATFTWNSSNGNWAVGSNWSPYGPPEYDGPTNGLDATVIPGGNPYLINNWGVHALSLGSGATLSITNGLTNGVLSNGTLRFNSCDTCPKEATVNNNGAILINNSASGQTSGMTTWDNTVTLTGSGTVVLGGYPQNYLDNSGWGGTYINDGEHTIRGGGTIIAGITNHNQIIADNGLLDVHGAITNGSGTVSVAGSDSVLQLRNLVQGGWIYPNDGTVILYPGNLANLNVGPGKVVKDPTGVGYLKGNVSFQAGAEVTLQEGSWLFFDNAPDATPPTITNNGVIRLNGKGAALQQTQLRSMAATTLTGSGRIVMGGDFDNFIYGYGFTNGANHTIEGGGRIIAMTNNGKVIANNGALTLGNYFSGPGTVTVADNAILQIDGIVELINLSLPRLATFNVSDSPLTMKGNFSFAMTDAARMIWAAGRTLKMMGQGPWQSLEVGGKDLGTVEEGFTNNFALEQLDVSGTGTRGYLNDAIDNGHRSSPECLYVKSNLYVRSGTILNLNGLKLYVHRSGFSGQYVYRVKAGDGSLFGGGQIIDVGPGRTAPAVNSLLLQ